MIALLVAVAFLCGVAAPPERSPSRAPPASLPADLPLDMAGVPTRLLTDDELYRLLVALSARNEPATMLLARCQAAGASAGTPGWRDCIMFEPRH